MPVIVQKYGGTSVGSVDRIRAVAGRIVHAREEGYDVVVVVSAMGHTTDELLAMAQSIAPLPEPRELDLLLTAGRADRDVDPRDRDQRDGMSRGELHGIAGRHHHRYPAREGQDRRRPTRAHPGIAQRRERRDRGGVPGRLHDAGRHDARTGRVGHDRRRARGGARRRLLRDLHRRRRCLHDGSEARRRRAQARVDLLRGDAGDGRERREACSSSDRSSTLGGTTCASTSAPRSPGSRGPGSRRRHPSAWSKRSSPALRSTTPRRRSRWRTFPTARASPPRSSRPSPARASTST